MSNLLKNDAVKYLSLNLSTHSVVFVPVRIQPIRFSILSKFSKSLGNTEKMSTPALLTYAYDRDCLDKLWGLYQNYGIHDSLLVTIKSMYNCS